MLTAVLFQMSYSQTITSYLVDPNKGPREHALDIEKMIVDVSFEPEAGRVIGEVTHEFTPLRTKIDTVLFDAPDITINKLVLSTVSGKKTTAVQNYTWHTVKEGLVLDLSKVKMNLNGKYILTIRYEAKPKKGIYFIGWNVKGVTDTRNQTRKQIWTQGQGIDNRHWIPMYDNSNDKFITETIIHFDSEYKVLSNGDLVSKKESKSNSTTTWHYKMRHPHAGYLLMLAIDKFAVKKTTTATGVPVQFWYYPEHEDKVEYTSRHTEQMIEFLEKETGFKYPWGAYSQVMVQEFIYGAMENTSATIFGDFFLSDAYSFNDRNYIGVNAHELTHQWFGDLVTARSSNGTWLQESFATYYSKMFIRELYGEDEYKMSQRGEVNQALNASLKDNYPVAHSLGGTARVYPKGSSVLQMLRYVLGDENFLRVIDAYLDKYAFQNVETNDLYQVIQDELGMNLDWFFEQWLYKGGEPHYEVSWELLGNKVQMVVRQIHEQDQVIGLFKMPVWVAVHYKDGSAEKKKVWIEKETELIQFENPDQKEVAFVLFDVNSELTKKLSFQRSQEELLSQMSHAAHMIDRYDAIAALHEIDEETLQAMIQAYNANEFYAIRAEIVKKIAKKVEAESFLISVLPSADLRVRRAYLNAINNVTENMRPVVESSLRDSSYININKALELLVRNFPEESVKYLDETSGIFGRSQEVRVKWLVYQVNSGNDQYKSELVNYSSDLYEFRTRINAFEGLVSINFLNKEAIEHLFSASLSLNQRLAAPAISTLKQFMKQEKYHRLINETFLNCTLSEIEKEQLVNKGVVN